MSKPETPLRPVFPKGNQLWQLRTSQGRDTLFADGDALWAEAIKYFAWCDNNPWLRPELVKFQGVADEYSVPLGRPYSIGGLCIFLDVSETFITNCRRNLLEKKENRADTFTEANQSLLDCIERIQNIVRTQNVEGAMLDVFNANFTARIHGLADTVNNNGNGEAILRVTVRDKETADNLNKLDALLK